jgi:plasmid stability protein
MPLWERPDRPCIVSAALKFGVNDTILEGTKMEALWNHVAMPTLTIKGLPDRLHEVLKMSAERNRRSLNSEVIARLEEAVGARAVEPETFLEEVRALRQRLRVPPLTEARLRRAKDEGRP